MQNDISLVWGSKIENGHPYQLELDSILQNSYPTAEMFLDSKGNNLCLKIDYVFNFHNMIMQAAKC